MAKTPVLYYFTLVMTGLYVVLGLIVMFAPQVENFLPGWKHWVLGAMLIVYAFIRYRRLQTIKNNMEQKLNEANREQE
ncbi:MAG: hypothetical protein IPN36_07690 [Bacteroidetes bacterium]|nr:hypothetical protein [Bacteroidota bacterium]MBL0095458.1 hypothetical protein [Bacteroidota bacterium]